MWQAFRNSFKIPELRDRIIFTFLMLAIFRIGIYIPIPGINLQAWTELFKGFGGGVAGGIVSFYDVFVGGALRRFSVFTLSVTPYINAAIILQLLSAVIPSLKEMLREGEEGRKKFAYYTRNLTVALAFFQSFVIIFALSGDQRIIAAQMSRLTFVLLGTLSLVAGTMFLLWIGELITQKGIGNGVSVLIFAGIVARYPAYFAEAIVKNLGIVGWLFLVGIWLFTIIAIVYVQQAERRIQIQYAHRVVGRKVYGGAATFIPIKVNHSGVIPIIFAAAIVSIPSAIARMMNSQTLANLFGSGSPLYLTTYALLVFFFTYFYSVVIFDPHDMSDNLKKYGGYIPGIRPGRPTEQYLHNVLNRVTFIGAIFLVIIAILPYLVQYIIKAQYIWIGGTSALIAVGVALDIAQQMEAHLMMHHYEGFIKKGKLRGRRA
jgi:preprotein translocase subunit SecY